MTVLLAYDGSEGADAAIAKAADILGGGAEAVVLSVWEPLVVEGLRADRFGGPLAVPVDVTDVDDRSEHAARQLAELGARIATDAGFEASPVWAADSRNIAQAIVGAADELDADVIVLGARGLTGVRAFLGSVSERVLEHAHRPVLVVPPTNRAGTDARAGALEAGAT